jgi:hypothetical protein
MEDAAFEFARENTFAREAEATCGGGEESGAGLATVEEESGG